MQLMNPDSNYKILLRMPNWLGDSVMVSASFELLKTYFPNAIFTLVGNEIACDIYRRDSRVKRIVVDITKKQKNRFYATMELAKNIGRHDISITFSNGFFSALLLYFTKTPIRIGYGKNFTSLLLTKKIHFINNIHQVLKYINLVNHLCNRDLITTSNTTNAISSPLNLIAKPIKHFSKNAKYRYIGISPGAAYGSAKRWEEQYFIEIIMYFLEHNYRVFLFGSANEEVLNEIDEILMSYKNSCNIKNLIGKTSITELCDYIAMMDLLITNDSGAMHIAAALNVPIVAMFGPTDSSDTSPWSANAVLLNKHLPCAPCKKRECPLIHHNCMKLITPNEVIESVCGILDR